MMSGELGAVNLVDRCRTIADGVAAAWGDAPEAHRAVLRDASDTLTAAATEIEWLQKPTFCIDDRDIDGLWPESPAGATGGDDVGDIVELRPIHELPAIFVVVGQTEKDCRVYTSRDDAEAAKRE